MSNQQAVDFCAIFRHLLSKQIAEYQEMIDRYTAVNAENIYGLELIQRETRWRRYAIAGLKTIRKNLTPNTVARWLEPMAGPLEEYDDATSDDRLDTGNDQLSNQGVGFPSD